ncbi:MAG: Rad52/Rad22 family DNA repair protein, partial [Ktedonobacterales bacterium]
MIEMRNSELSSDQWQEIARKLQAPFDRDDVEFRVQGRVSDQSGRAQVVAYVDARVVQDRLDQVVGPGNWSFDWEPVLVENGQVMLAKGTLTVLGVAKSDIGSASNFEQSLGCVSHAFKRAAVHWGVGRYLYGLPMTWVNVEKGGRLSEAVMTSLRNSLPRFAEVAQAQDEASKKREPRKMTAPAAAASAAPRRQSVIREAPLQEPVAEAPERAASETRGDEPAATEQQLVSIRKLCEALK